jgi:hypothetical protein
MTATGSTSLLSRALQRSLMGAYCAAIFLSLDFLYSNFIYDGPYEARVAHSEFHHGLAPNFSGYSKWGPIRYPLRTNSLGFRDAKVREVPLGSETRRVLLIGDSFTEGVGLAFEDTFAGLLFEAGQHAEPRTEFLNAGVVTYSPAIYYKKIKFLLEHGLKIDEAVVLPDYGDVQDEAVVYFCIDDDPQYRAFCIPPRPPSPLPRNFVVSDAVRVFVKTKIAKWRHGSESRVEPYSMNINETDWTLSEDSWGSSVFQPLGLQGGITRAVKNMQSLADLLASRGIALIVAVYPRHRQLAHNDRDSQYVAMWRDFCSSNCKEFIDLFPAFFAEKDTHEDWYERLFLPGDIHYSATGNKIIFHELANHLLKTRAPAKVARPQGSLDSPR